MAKKLEIDRGRWLAASPYLNQALDLPPDRLSGWLQELEITQPAIAVDVRRLMSMRGDLFESFLAGQAPLLPPHARCLHQGAIVGRYRLLRELGSGGMAVVYLAERADGHFEQRVAVKVLRFGADTTEARRHFAQERQILASLDHPAIARLIDGGITGEGLPYLAMEYVEGLPIDRFCDQQRLGLTERLQLLLKVADAVQYAHHHLIVHRDLKPSNIIVTREATIKLLDFGIAKLLDPESFGHAAPITRDVVRLLTPDYASPEQARGDPITAATDVYQLGRLLYELLTGHAPYSRPARNSLDSLRVILESEPIPPSSAVHPVLSNRSQEQRTHLETLSAARALTPARLHQLLRGDLDAIVLMALRKQPSQRYSSVAKLAEDIEHYLEHRPVHAAEGLWLYRANKFARRHVAGMLVASLMLCTFALLIVWHSTQLASERDHAAAEAQRARREAASSQQIAAFLSSVFRGSDSGMAKGQTTARELLDRGADRIETQLADQPAIQARLLNVIGNVYAQYDVKDKAQALVERALRQNVQLFGEDSLEAAESKFALAPILRDRGDLVRARQLLEDVLRTRERVLGPGDLATADTLHALAVNLSRQGQSRAAIQMCERALAIYAGAVDPYDERAVNAKVTLGAALLAAGDMERAREHYQQLVPAIEHSLGADHRNLAAALTNLAIAKIQLDDYAGAEQQLLRARAILERLYTANHGHIQAVLSTLGTLYLNTGRLQDAGRLYAQSIDMSRRINGPGNALEATPQQMWGQALRVVGDFTAAQAHIEAAVQIWRHLPSESHVRYALSLAEQGELLLDQNNATLAAGPLDEALDLLRKELPTEGFDFANVLLIHGEMLARTGHAVQSESELRQVIAIYEQILPATHRELAAARSALGEALLAQGKLAAAEPLLIASHAVLATTWEAARRRSLQRLIQLYRSKHESASLEQYRKQLAEFEREVRAR